jgi:hypothetical protein
MHGTRHREAAAECVMYWDMSMSTIRLYIKHFITEHNNETGRGAKLGHFHSMNTNRS